MRKLILASASPRRSEMLDRMGFCFTVEESGADENAGDLSDPGAYALGAARAKALKVAEGKGPEDYVLAADTIVVKDGRIMGKPASEDEAAEMLALLSGTWHEVITAVVLAGGGSVSERVVSTKVRFVGLSPGEIRWYAQTGEPMDKAGAYAIQGLAAAFVGSIEGSYTNVVGLPLAETVEMLEKAGFAPWRRLI